MHFMLKGLVLRSSATPEIACFSGLTIFNGVALSVGLSFALSIPQPVAMIPVCSINPSKSEWTPPAAPLF